MNDILPTNTRSWMAVAVTAGLFYLAGQYIVSSPGRQAISPENTHQIQVQGSGEVHAKPDIARLTLGVTTGPQPSAKQALDMLSQKFQKVVNAVKASGVKEEDIKTTNLNINPSYDYTSGQQTIRGYEASESIEVKIRNLDKVGDIVAAATAQGVNQAGGVMFDIDKPDVLQEEAQAKAIANARAKAKKLAQDLGVTLGNVKSFTATNAQPPYSIPYAMEAKQADNANAVVAPPVPAGTYDITANVSITYELR